MSQEKYIRQYFTQTEAEAKVGRQIQTRVEFSAVPRGTTGQVISADEAGWAKPPFGEQEEAYDVAIQWELPRPEPSADLMIPAGKPLVDWFTSDL